MAVQTVTDILLTSIFSTLSLLLDVFLYWQLRLWSLLWRPKPTTLLKQRMSTARTFEDWHAAGLTLDSALGLDLWRQTPLSKDYDYNLIFARLQHLLAIKESGDIDGLIVGLRSGLLRNLGNITTPSLFNRSYVGSKVLVEEYISEVCRAIGMIEASPLLSDQSKLSFVAETRQSFGRTTLVLQGGAIFGLCHLGVIKALYLRGLLPRIITGTAVGALIAALVSIHTDDELPHFLSGAGIDLSAFATRSPTGSWRRKMHRLLTSGYLLDMSVLQACVHANVGDLTFAEAYERTGRILNITVAAASPADGVPCVFNYLTSPNVLIWSAACASNAAPSPPLFAPIRGGLLCKDPTTGAVIPCPVTPAPSRAANPHTRIAELFNVNHFILSQARPYVLPFLSTASTHHPYLLFRLLGLELRHLLHQLDTLGLLRPTSIRRLLVVDTSDSVAARITVVPDVGWTDWGGLLANPNKSTVDYWVLKGERSVWGVMEMLRVAVGIEGVLDRAYVGLRGRGRGKGRGRGREEEEEAVKEEEEEEEEAVKEEVVVEEEVENEVDTGDGEDGLGLAGLGAGLGERVGERLDGSGRWGGPGRGPMRREKGRRQSQ